MIMFSASVHSAAGRKLIRRIKKEIEYSQKMKMKKQRNKSKKRWPKLAKLPPAPQNIVPKLFKDPPPNLKPLLTAPKAARKEARRELREWLKENAGIIIMNFGSICSFMSFTRTDILELRLLSITGSVSMIIYFFARPPPLVIAPIVWSTIFASTNLCMIYLIYEERKGKVEPMTEDEESAYEEHFLPHAVTPRQYEKLLQIAKKRELSKGDILIQKGDEMSSVYLVVRGATEAVNTISKRRVTAASSAKGYKDKFAGGDSGAWIGDIFFFDYLERREKKLFQKPSPPEILATAPITEVPLKRVFTRNAILTYLVTKDSTLVFQWDFEELADLMRTSSELRSSVSRAMTAAVIGKVVNLYISKTDANKPGWKQWLEDNFNSGSTSEVHINVVTKD